MNERIKDLLKRAGIATCSTFASCVVAEWARARGPEQFEAGFEELVKTKALLDRSPYRFQDTLLDEWVRRLRGRYGREASPADIAAGVSFRADIAAFARELQRRIDGPERRRLTGRAASPESPASTSETAELAERVQRLEELLGLSASGDAERARPGQDAPGAADDGIGDEEPND